MNDNQKDKKNIANDKNINNRVNRQIKQIFVLRKNSKNIFNTR